MTQSVSRRLNVSHALRYTRQASSKVGMMTIKIFYLGVILGLGILALGCQEVPKPELKGKGPLAVVLPRGTAVPETHAPLDSWRTNHKVALNRGDFSQKECILCHNPRTGCNRCHQYIGAQEVKIPEASLYYDGETKK